MILSVRRFEKAVSLSCEVLTKQQILCWRLQAALTFWLSVVVVFFLFYFILFQADLDDSHQGC